MDSLRAFMRETYISNYKYIPASLVYIGSRIFDPKPDSRLPVKDIYEDFRAWIIGKYGISKWNNITQRQVYSALKELQDYAYVRYREGYSLKGIAYKSNKRT